MSVLTTLEEHTSFANYNGGLNFSKYNLYVPIILNRKYINIVGNPFTSSYHCVLLTRTTSVMHKVLGVIETSNLLWKTPRRVGTLK